MRFVALLAVAAVLGTLACRQPQAPVAEAATAPPPAAEQEEALLEEPLLLEDPQDSEGSFELLVDNSRCYVCHLNFEEEVLTLRHAREGIGCEDCHGPSDAHCSDEDNITPPDVMIPEEDVDTSCRRCHDVPMEGHALAGAAAMDLTCTECHGEHRLSHRTRVWDRHTGALIEDDQVRMLADPAPGAGSVREAPAQARLEGWWTLDESSGAVAADSSENGRDAVLMGDGTFETQSAPGRLGGALRLDGENDFLEVTGYPGVSGPRPRTLAAWIQTSDRSGELFSWGGDEPGGMWYFRVVGTGIRADPGGGYLYTDSPVHDGQWHHVAVVVDAGEPPNLHDHVRLYKDGELQQIHDIGLLDLWPIETGVGRDVRIGRGFTGLLDDLRIYEGALTGAQIRDLAAAEE